MNGSDSTNEASGGQGRVVVGVSGSPAGLAALRAAAHEARTSGRPLLAVLAWQPPEGEAGYMLRPDRVWAENWRRMAAARLDRAFDDAFGGDPPGIAEVERRLVRGKPWRALCTTANRPDDRLVIGTRVAPRGLFRYGGTRRRVLARASCPVLTVPAPRFPAYMRTRLRHASPADFVSKGPGGAPA
ncbi:universal stress protein [Streptomyces oryzae]|uniref:Universal stress protein n=1 Tax=Streptomyces oryzae TaxID=1434886 RepID=A0ABS3XF24_9ACTN|nr:universal stress protein [Streptomyces oryzae]MBO8193627.1 universal stress protein [Streptomyces oryzae]